ncbi:nitronate monooxygenase family protein [Novosphingobium sp. TCA1]|uniref:NAD(P)H-dependent flavin oxidoreductase n=1 Tax=Novosphingobium sp. TCA1 TaxID=2682474 RepID=UPI00130A2C96|nr:nitronate monooxygenase [Novosphingobium sp. TCA1]GFE75319.1 2-nitropropane dioxygenase [Novosphingobium sp. TCA1]
MDFVARLGLSIPLIQAPMAGTSTPALAAEVCNAGALGSLALGAVGPEEARRQIADLRGQTDRPFNLNLFVHEAPRTDLAREQAWLDALAPAFAAFGASPPPALETIYQSFAGHAEMLDVVLEARPAVVSFHFGLPDSRAIAALKAAGCLLLGSVTSLAEAELSLAAGIDVVVAQGWEAGGHRGLFDPDAADDRLGTLALTRLLARWGKLPVIAAGGIMDGAGIRAALDLGAVATQLGTAFVACPESSADAGYRALLASDAALHTTMTRAISGRPARCLANRFTQLGERADLPPVPDYPRTYHAGKALNAAAKAQGEPLYGAQWAGQGAPLSRPMAAAELVALLAAELALTRP